MDITCEKCQHHIKIPDEKLPSGKTASFLCPKCRHRITVSAPPSEGEAGGAPADRPREPAFPEGDAAADAYDASEKPFDFVEEEGKTALVCETDPEVLSRISRDLELMEYYTTEAKNSREALKNMRYHQYDLLVVNEAFDTRDPDANRVLIFLERLGMSVRRDMFVAMLSDRFRTLDHMTAFHRSVNLIINLTNMDDFGRILSRGIADHGFFYRVYKESMRRVGLI